jgi:hypothetical protein
VCRSGSAYDLLSIRIDTQVSARVCLIHPLISKSSPTTLPHQRARKYPISGGRNKMEERLPSQTFATFFAVSLALERTSTSVAALYTRV